MVSCGVLVVRSNVSRFLWFVGSSVLSSVSCSCSSVLVVLCGVLVGLSSVTCSLWCVGCSEQC